MMKPKDTHNSYRYTQGCRCKVCTAAMTRAQTKYRLRKLQSIPKKELVPVESTRRRLKILYNRGYSDRYIAERTGYSVKYVGKVRRDGGKKGLQSQVRKDFADKIEKMVLTPSVLKSTYDKPSMRRGYVPVDKSRRIIQGLALQKWSMTQISEMTGIASERLHLMCSTDKIHFIRPETEQKLFAAMREIGLREGPSNPVRILALKKGYKALAWWDDLI